MTSAPSICSKKFMSEPLRTMTNIPALLHIRRLILIAFPIVAIAAFLNAAWHIGPWFDEFWSYYFADPSVRIGEAFHFRWTSDVHPPLFSFLSWMASNIGLPRTIEAGRMLNLLPLLASVAYLAAFWRFNRQDRPFLLTFVPGVFALVQVLATFAEFRSYFTGVSAFIILLVTLKRLHRRGEERLQGGNAILVWSGHVVSLGLCINLHFVFSILAVAVVGTFAFAALLRGDRSLFLAHLLTGIACCLPLAVTTAFQWSYLTATSKDYWLKTSPLHAMSLMFQSMLMPLDQSTATTAAWLGALGTRVLSREGRRADDLYAVTLLVSIVSSGILVFVYTAATGALAIRYLVPICILVTAALAAACGQALRTHGLVQVLFLIFCLAAIVDTSVQAARIPQWNEAARFVAARQKACPGARIAPLRAVLKDNTANVEANYDMAYQYLAKRWHMTVGALDRMPGTRPDPTCPDYYWIDNQFAAARRSEPVLKAELLQRFPKLEGCSLLTHVMSSDAVVFEVTGEPPTCHR